MSYLSFAFQLSYTSELCGKAMFAFVFSPGPPEMLLLLVIALLLYGGKLPEMARTWGKMLGEFRRSLSGIQREFNDAIYSDNEQLTYKPENDPYTNETSGYEEESRDDLSQDDPSTTVSPEDAAPDDSQEAEQLSPEKQSTADSD